MAENSASSLIPADFQQVEYIAYVGHGNYLYSNIAVNSMTTVVSDIAKTSLPSTNSGSIFPCIGTAGSTPSGTVWGTLENVSGSAFEASPAHTKTQTFSRTTITSTKTTASGTQKIGLGYNKAAFSPGLSFYSLKIYNGTTLLFDGIPCYRKSDSKIGLYDLIGESFYETSGTWSKGDDVA